jgi:large subunit ribosomal protein L24
MQRILRINVRSRNQALKAQRKAIKKAEKKDWADYDERRLMNEQERNKLIKAEKKARHEDWLLGPLAPKRDVGLKQKVYGTVNGALTVGPVFPRSARKGPKSRGWDLVGGEGRQKEWKGFGNEGNIVEGDRVVVVKGRPDVMGQIGTVKEVKMDSKEVFVEGLNQVCFSVLTKDRSSKCD